MPYKVSVFGIMCELLVKLVLVILLEDAVTSKGFSQIISLLHLYFKFGRSRSECG